MQSYARWRSRSRTACSGASPRPRDVVQEGFLRLHEALTRETRIESPRAYLSTIVTRIAIDHLRRARVRREQCVGEWLPEPLLEDPMPGITRAIPTSASRPLRRTSTATTLRPVPTSPSFITLPILTRTDSTGTRTAWAAKRRYAWGRPEDTTSTASAGLFVCELRLLAEARPQRRRARAARTRPRSARPRSRRGAGRRRRS